MFRNDDDNLLRDGLGHPLPLFLVSVHAGAVVVAIILHLLTGYTEIGSPGVWVLVLADVPLFWITPTAIEASFDSFWSLFLYAALAGTVVWFLLGWAVAIGIVWLNRTGE